AVGAVTLSTPRGLVLRRLTKSSASAIRLRMSTTRLKYPSPVSVSVSWRVVRWKSRVPSLSSRRLTRFETTAGDSPISRPAADIFPVRATRAKISRSVMAVTALSPRNARSRPLYALHTEEFIMPANDQSVSLGLTRQDEYCSAVLKIRGADVPKTHLSASGF